MDCPSTPYTKTQSPYTKRANPYGKAQSPYGKRANPYGLRTDPYSAYELCVLLLEDGSYLLLETGEKIHL